MWGEYFESMTDGQWAPKSDFLSLDKQHNNNNSSNYSRSKSCGRVVASSNSDEFRDLPFYMLFKSPKINLVLFPIELLKQFMIF